MYFFDLWGQNGILKTMDYEGLLSPSETMKLLLKIEHLPKKKLGQNFLVDANIVRKSLELARLEAGESVVEVGPGLGTLTGAMLKAGAKVYAVELDKNLFSFLQEAYAAERNLSLMNNDALLAPLAGLPKDTESFKIIANLPYAISTPWLDRVLSQKFLPNAMALMLQKEAALRFTAGPGGKNYSPITIFLGAAYDFRPLHKVSAACFYPRPGVDSALLALSLKEKPYVFSFGVKNLMRKIFLKRRKQIGAIIKALDGAEAQKASAWLECCAAEGLKPAMRPEEIEPRLWKNLNDTWQ